MMDRRFLDLTTEEALEPELEIVDPHHHLWNVQSAYGLYEIDDLRTDTDAGHNVVQTVFIDCGSNYFDDGPAHMRPVGETVYVAERADRTDETPGATMAAIVSHADLSLGNGVAEVLEAHVAAAGGRFRGIRHSAAKSDDPSIPVSRTGRPLGEYGDQQFRAGAAVLASMGLSFEAWQYHYQLDDVVGLARAVPELSIIVNHLGGPLLVGSHAGKEGEVFAQIRSSLTELAGCENVTLKVGGIGMTRAGGAGGPADGSRPPTSDEVLERWGEMLQFSIETFGPSRCMFESNFPVDGETVSYTVLWNAFKKVSSEYSSSERADLFADTARRTYRL